MISELKMFQSTGSPFVWDIPSAVTSSNTLSTLSRTVASLLIERFCERACLYLANRLIQMGNADVGVCDVFCTYFLSGQRLSTLLSPSLFLSLSLSLSLSMFLSLSLSFPFYISFLSLITFFSDEWERLCL